MNSSNSSKKREPDTTIAKFPCKLCPKNVSDNDNAILCGLCQTWVHIKCNHLNYIDYKYLQGCNEPWYCLSCTTMHFLFGNLNNQKFLGFIIIINNNNDNNNNNNNNNKSKNSNSSLILKPAPDQALLFNQFNNAIPENISDLENVIQSKYYGIDELQQLKLPNNEKSLSFFHINSLSLNKNFVKLTYKIYCSQQIFSLM